MTVSATPFGAPYLEVLAETLLQRHTATPHSLAEVVVFLPTRRAVKTLEDLLFTKQEQAGATAILLPHITSITELSPSLPYPLPPTPPAASPLQRQLTLAKQLISAQYSLPQALGIAETLLPILDEFHSEDKTADSLASLDTGGFSAHWAKTTELLSTALKTDENSAVTLAKQGLRALCAYWQECPAKNPVYAAGILNISPYILEFLESVHSLPQGNVVLPNVDLQRANPQKITLPLWHPQYKIAKTLTYLGVEHENLELLTQNAKIAPLSQQNIARLLMLPANALNQWHTADSDAIATGLNPLSVLDCATTTEESLCIALKIREALENKKKEVAFVTADRSLATRVAHQLLCWNIVANNSSGTPLNATPPLVFMRILLETTQEILQPVALLSLLKHPLYRQNLPSDVVRRYARAFERLVLRAPRAGNSLIAYQRALNRVLEKPNAAPILENYGVTAEELSTWFTALTELLTVKAAQSLDSALKTHVAIAEKLSTDNEGICQLWQEEAGSVFAETLLAVLPQTELPYRPQDLPFLFTQLFQHGTLPATFGFHPRCHIWGMLEAQGQSADVVIIGGLQQGILPSSHRVDPFLNRAMREQLGLPLPELSLSQEAHTFCSLLMAPEVLLTYSHRCNAAPALPSPWIEKLYALATLHKSEHSLTRNQFLKSLAQQLDFPSQRHTVSEPLAAPPRHSRPRKFSASSLTLLMKNPYAYYAKYILRLTPLDPLDKAPDNSEKGKVIHSLLEKFLKTYPLTLPENALEILENSGIEAFRTAFDTPEAKLFWEHRFKTVAAWFIKTEIEQRANNWQPKNLEISGQYTLGNFTIGARADRLDTHAFGNVIHCIDYKTGTPPTAKDITEGRDIQLCIQALIAQQGGFGHTPPPRIGAISYWALLGKSDTAGKIVSLDAGLDDLLPTTQEYILALLSAFDNDTQPYLVKPLPWKMPHNDYDHLERHTEWA